MKGEVAVLSQLGATAAITALVSTRIYQGERPQRSIIPAIVVDLDRSEPVMSKDVTATGQSVDIDYVYVQAYGKDYNEAQSVAIQIRTALDYLFKTETTIGGVVVQQIRMMSQIYDHYSIADREIWYFEQEYAVRTRN